MEEPTLPARVKSEEELVREGWTRRFTVGPDRLQEVLDLFCSLGHEVHLEPITPQDLHGPCHECQLAVALLRVVYTRPAKGNP